MQKDGSLPRYARVFELYDTMNDCLYVKHSLPEILAVAERLPCGVFAERLHGDEQPRILHRKDAEGRWIQTPVKTAGLREPTTMPQHAQKGRGA